MRAPHLASPPLVVAHALAGHVIINLTADPIGIGKDGREVDLKDIRPTTRERADPVEQPMARKLFPEEIRRCLKS